MRPFLTALAVLFLSFLPFHLATSPSPGGITVVKLSPEAFKPESPGSLTDGTIRFHLSSDPKTLNPALAMETSSTAVLADLFEGLTRLNVKTLRPEPALAERWEVLDGGKRWRFYLRKGVYWHDGKPFTADDVVFTYRQVYLNDEIPTSVGDVLKVKGKKIEVRKVDRYAVEFVLPEPFAPFLSALSAEILPKHKLEPFVKSGTFTTAWTVNAPPSEIVGTGPYKLVKYEKGQRVLYERNPLYYRRDEQGRPLPYVKRKVGLIVPDPETALLRFIRGELDYLGVRAQDLLFLAAQKEKNFVVYDLGATPSTTFLVFNQNPESSVPKYKIKWFRNRLFRVALSHAVDREGIVRLVYNGLAEPLYTPVTPANRPYYDESYYPKFPYDLKKARELLRRAGFTDRDGDGWLEDPEGNEVSFTLLTNAGNRERELIGAIIKEDFKKLGIKVHFQPVDFNSLVTRLTSPPYAWEAVIIGLTGSVDPHFGRNVWHSSGSLHMWYPRQKKPSTEWERKVDELFDRAASELNYEKRVKLYKEAFRIITEQQPMLFIAAPRSMIAVNSRLKNAFPTVWGWYEPLRLFVRD
ncbi:MAG: ABC transporter substrate-binding protein [Aquificae bacterium]|nr:ABC transporter substrate-binding protein [Aquificota bacterium]